MLLPVFFRPRFGQKKSTVLSRTDIEKTETPSVKVCCMICKIFQKVLNSKISYLIEHFVCISLKIAQNCT